MIVKVGPGRYQVRSGDGKKALSADNLTKEEAKKRLAQVEMFKHMDKAMYIHFIDVEKGGPGSGRYVHTKHGRVDFKLQRTSEDSHDVLVNGEKVGAVHQGWWRLGGAGWTHNLSHSAKQGDTPTAAARDLVKKVTEAKHDETEPMLYNVDKITSKIIYREKIGDKHEFGYLDQQYAGSPLVHKPLPEAKTLEEAKQLIRGKSPEDFKQLHEYLKLTMPERVRYK
jgi:hypothetical protein